MSDPSKKPGIKLLNLKGIRRKTKNMNDPSLVIADGTYQGIPNALGYPICVDLARIVCAGHDRPGYWEVGTCDDNEDCLTAIPSLVETEATISCRWDPAKDLLVLDMLPILLIRKMTIPKETNVHIPISAKSLPGTGPVLLLHFDQLTYQPVEKGKRKKNGQTA